MSSSTTSPPVTTTTTTTTPSSSQHSPIVYDLSSYIDFTRLDDDEYLASLHLKKLKPHSGNSFILKYDKESLNATNYKTLGLFRSVIFQDGKVVCFSPPKSLPMEFFKQECGCGEESLHYEEFVEGTMVNLYFDGVKNDWEVATRSSIGARKNFYKGSDSFRHLFLDAMNQYTFSFEDLDKTKIYSFVLQHPQNRIVADVKKPRLFLCEVYRVMEDGVRVEALGVKGQIEDANLRTPYDYVDEYKREYSQMFPLMIRNISGMYANKQMTPFYVMGYVVKDQNGNRTKVRNQKYEYVRSLRGNQSKKQYHYYSMRNTGKLDAYLTYYPEDRALFREYRDKLHNYTENLYQYYVDCFIKKEKPLSDYPFQYKPHLYKLHEKYIHELSPQKKYVQKYTVIQYVNELDAAQKMFCVNYIPPVGADVSADADVGAGIDCSVSNDE